MEFFRKHRSLFQFFGWVLSGALVGLLIAFGFNMLNENMELIMAQVENWLIGALVPIEATLLLLLVVASLGLYGVGRGRMLKSAGGGDLDRLYDRGNYLLGMGMATVNVGTVLIYGLFGIGASVIPIKAHFLTFALHVGILFLMMIYQTAYCVRVIAFLKRCNPEKRGDPLEMRFQKDWEQSCDEVEKLAIYRASYSTFQLLAKVIMGLWVLVVCTGMLLGTGIYPIVIVTIVWFAHTVGYQYYALRLERQKLNR